MRAVQRIIAACKSWVPGKATNHTYETRLMQYIDGLIVGFADGITDRGYDDGRDQPHELIVCVPDAGSSCFAAGYRNGYLSGQDERLKSE